MPSLLYTGEALWEGREIPAPIFHLLEAGSFLSFTHGFRLGAQLAGRDGGFHSSIFFKYCPV